MSGWTNLHGMQSKVSRNSTNNTKEGNLKEMRQEEKQKKTQEILDFIRANPNCVPNQVYKHFNGYNWDPEYILDIDAEILAELVDELIKNGTISMNQNHQLTVPQEIPQ